MLTVSDFLFVYSTFMPRRLPQGQAHLATKVPNHAKEQKRDSDSSIFFCEKFKLK